MDNLTAEQIKALRSLRADRLGFFLMGFILGGCMIATAAWGFWSFGVRKVWMILAGIGCIFVQGGISIWKDKTNEIRQLLDPTLRAHERSLKPHV